MISLDDDFVEDLADRVARKLEAKLRLGWVDQATSPLGRRRHIDLARRLIAAGDPLAVQLGRRFLVQRDCVDEQLRVLGRRTQPKRTEPDVDELASDLGLTKR